jgi:hypothetical protein
MILNPISVFL